MTTILSSYNTSPQKNVTDILMNIRCFYYCLFVCLYSKCIQSINAAKKKPKRFFGRHIKKMINQSAHHHEFFFCFVCSTFIYLMCFHSIYLSIYRFFGWIDECLNLDSKWLDSSYRIFQWISIHQSILIFFHSNWRRLFAYHPLIIPFFQEICVLLMMMNIMIYL